LNRGGADAALPYELLSGANASWRGILRFELVFERIQAGFGMNVNCGTNILEVGSFLKRLNQAIGLLGGPIHTRFFECTFPQRPASLCLGWRSKTPMFSSVIRQKRSPQRKICRAEHFFLAANQSL
jgi:hypothetical protein